MRGQKSIAIADPLANGGAVSNDLLQGPRQIGRILGLEHRAEPLLGNQIRHEADVAHDHRQTGVEIVEQLVGQGDLGIAVVGQRMNASGGIPKKARNETWLDVRQDMQALAGTVLLCIGDER